LEIPSDSIRIDIDTFALIVPYLIERSQVENKAKKKLEEIDSTVQAILTASFPAFAGGDWVYSDGYFVPVER
jgi:hypothetical protein